MGLLAGLYEPGTNCLYGIEPGLYTSEKGAFLKAVYDYRMLAETHEIASAFAGWGSRGMKAFIDLLPVSRPDHIPFKIISTGCKKIWGRPGVYLKKESLQPAGSISSRGVCLIGGLAVEAEKSGIVAFSRQSETVAAFIHLANFVEQQILLFVPQSLELKLKPEEFPENFNCRREAGTDSELYDRVRQVVDERGWYNGTAGYNPYFREAYKTLAFEIYLELGAVPERLYLSPSEGEVLSGVAKGFEELRNTGWTAAVPEIYAVLGPSSSSRLRWLEESAGQRKKLSNIELSGMQRGLIDLYFAIEAIEQTGGEVVSLSRSALKEYSRKSEIEKINVNDGTLMPADLLAAFESTEPANFENIVLLETGISTGRLFAEADNLN